MAKNDDPLVVPQDILTALALLTRFPLPRFDAERGAKAAWAYPVVGLVIGSLAAGCGYLAFGLGLPSPIIALIVIAFLVLSTGAMHEDGLTDTADGLWGGWTREKRLEIMRDSHIGTYGVIALILSIAARWGSLWLLYDIGPGFAAAAITAAAALSRGLMPALMTLLPHARDDGLSQTVGHVGQNTAILAITLGLITGLVFTGFDVFAAAFASIAAAGVIGLIAKSKIGGQTGDILGATQQTAEIAILFSILI